MGDDTVEDEVPHCPKVTTPEAVEGFANLPPARLSAHPIVSGSSWVSGMGSFELVECPESDEARG